MRTGLVLLLAITMSGCTPSPPYSWQDTREPAREDFSIDLEACRSYAARQYKPGIPAGAPYLSDAERTRRADDEQPEGVWRPDRSPFPSTNVNRQPLHDVPVDYTGYPGELDYNPSYLDEILEKCMLDHGWRYQPNKEIP